MYVKKVFSSSNWDINTATLRFSEFWSIFTEIDKKNCHVSQNIFYLNKLNIYLCFSNQNEQYTAKQSLFVVLQAFLQKLTKNLLFMSKKCFSNQIKPHSVTLSFSFEEFFSEIDQKIIMYVKKCFLIKLSHIQLN